MRDTEGMSIIVRVVTRWLFGLVLVFGLAVALLGHLSPGGGFAGGVVVACGYVLTTLAFGARTGPAAPAGRAAAVLESIGALGVVLLAAGGWLAGHWFEQWLRRGEPFTVGSTPFIVFCNLAILLKVGAGLFAGFLALAAFRSGRKETEA